MAQIYFGTDGIRGISNRDPMTAETTMRIGMAVGSVFTHSKSVRRAVIGKDTRLSGYLLEPALTAGLISVGMDVVIGGPMPTPALAMLTKSLGADLGVMISASHNPYQDNGIKLFSSDGHKLSDELEAKIEERIDSELEQFREAPERLGRAHRLKDGQNRYIESVKKTFPDNLTLRGLRIVVDCANGAAYRVAPTILSELGAEVITLGVNPNGTNINRACGSTHPEHMQKQVMLCSADVGLSLDGDADRLLMADDTGALIDGDQILALIAKRYHASGELTGGGVVGTVMSNLGLENYLAELGLDLERTRVGDRYVVEHMRKCGFNLGGEQSGHIVLSDFATTGDGLVAALQCLAVLVESEKLSSEVLRCFEAIPQTIHNINLENMDTEDTQLDAAIIVEATKVGESILKGRGRLLIRPSGTEPVIRVMVEGEDESLIDKVVSEVSNVLLGCTN